MLFTAAELARRRLREGVPLSHPDCVALACDAVLERARAGAELRGGQAAVPGHRPRDQLAPGVAELLEAPLQVEAAFGDGSRLVALEGSGGGVSGVGRPGEPIVGSGPAPAAQPARTATITITNRGRFDAYPDLALPDRARERCAGVPARGPRGRAACTCRPAASVRSRRARPARLELMWD